MKKLVVIFVTLSLSKGIFSQNVGIGTATPSSKLHVKGTGSGTQIVLEENAGSILRISNEPSGTGPYIGTTTNNPLSLVTNNSAKLTISTAGNIGIGQSSPTSPLHFSNTLGSKIALWGANPNHYGIGIQAFQMQFYTPANTDDFVFGHGNSSSLIETMRIKGNGNIGIGTNNPLTTLDVNGDVNIQNRLFINNSTGNDGQVLVSNGNAAPSWQNVAYSNNDRFYYISDNDAFFNITDTLGYNQRYAYSSAITYNSSSKLFTVNKSGLYKIEGSITLQIRTTNSSTYPFAYFVLAFNTPFGVDFLVTMADALNYSGGSDWRKTQPFASNYYLWAGTTFYMDASITTNNGTASIVSKQMYFSPLSINLISE
jgi:hypothetical protein